MHVRAAPQLNCAWSARISPEACWACRRSAALCTGGQGLGSPGWQCGQMMPVLDHKALWPVAVTSACLAVVGWGSELNMCWQCCDGGTLQMMDG